MSQVVAKNIDNGIFMIEPKTLQTICSFMTPNPLAIFT